MDNVNISFAGCGFLGIYHVGVASCIKEYAPHLLLNKISGASIGGLAGACLLTDVPLGKYIISKFRVTEEECTIMIIFVGTFTSDMLRIIYEIRRRTLGPFNPLIHVQNMLRRIVTDVSMRVSLIVQTLGMCACSTQSIMLQIFQRLPEDAHKTVSGKLFISLTKVSDGSNVIMSEFSSNEELINVSILPTVMKNLAIRAITDHQLVSVHSSLMSKSKSFIFIDLKV